VTPQPRRRTTATRSRARAKSRHGRRRRSTPASPPSFEIWQAPDGAVHSVDHAIRRQVLAELAVAPRTLPQLAARTGRTKSTLSDVHLRALVGAGLVTPALDPADRRVKWYRLAGRRLGASDVAVPELREAVLGYARAQAWTQILDVLDVERLTQQDPTYVQAVARRLGEAVRRAGVAAQAWLEETRRSTPAGSRRAFLDDVHAAAG